jgi:hypothetical protein
MFSVRDIPGIVSRSLVAISSIQRHLLCSTRQRHRQLVYPVHIGTSITKLAASGTRSSFGFEVTSRASLNLFRPYQAMTGASDRLQSSRTPTLATIGIDLFSVVAQHLRFIVLGHEEVPRQTGRRTLRIPRLFRCKSCSLDHVTIQFHR